MTPEQYDIIVILVLGGLSVGCMLAGAVALIFGMDHSKPRQVREDNELLKYLFDD